MPTYEYLCSNCANEWEEVQKISEPALEICPKCGKSTAKRQISAGNFILKGGGWYSDAYSSKSNKPSSDKSEKSEKSEKSSSDTSTKSESTTSTTKETTTTTTKADAAPAASTTPSTPAKK